MDTDEAAVLLQSRPVGPEPGRHGRLFGAGQPMPARLRVKDQRHRPSARTRRHEIGENGLRQGGAHGFDQHADRAAAGKAHCEGLVVGHPEGQDPRAPVGPRLCRLGDDGAFDAAARDRAHHLAIVRDHELASRGPRRRAPGLEHRGNHGRSTRAVPVERKFGYIVVAGQGCLPVVSAIMRRGTEGPPVPKGGMAARGWQATGADPRRLSSTPSASAA